MTNAISNLTLGNDIELMNGQNYNIQCCNLEGFDLLLSNLLGNTDDSKGNGDKKQTNSPDLYAGLIGAMLYMANNNNRENTELNNSDTGVLVSNINQKSQPNNEELLKLQSNNEQVQKLLTNLIDNFKSENNNINIETLRKYFEVSSDKTSVLTDDEINQIAEHLTNLINNKSDGSKEKTIDTELIKLSDILSSVSSNMKNTNKNEIDANINIPNADIPEKVSNINITKGNDKAENKNTDKLIKELKIPIDVIKAENKQNENLSFSDANKNSNFKLIERAEKSSVLKVSEGSDNEVKENKSSNHTQPIDVYVFDKSESIRTDGTKALIDKTDKITQAVEKQIIKSAVFTENNGKQEYEINLKPEFLGKIVIKLQSGEDGMNVKIITSNPNVKDILSAQSPQMQDIIKNQGVDLKNVEVVYTGLTSGNNDMSNGNRYKNASKKNTNKIKGEYEQAIVNGISQPDGSMQINYNGSVNYLV